MAKVMVIINIVAVVATVYFVICYALLGKVRNAMIDRGMEVEPSLKQYIETLRSWLECIRAKGVMERGFGAKITEFANKMDSADTMQEALSLQKEMRTIVKQVVQECDRKAEIREDQGYKEAYEQVQLTEEKLLSNCKAYNDATAVYNKKIKFPFFILAAKFLHFEEYNALEV